MTASNGSGAVPLGHRTATLVIVQTSEHCLSYGLTDAAGRVLWSNRVYAIPEGDTGARRRLEAWAAAHWYRVVEAGKEVSTDCRATYYGRAS